jgi:hypothetical protein
MTGAGKPRDAIGDTQQEVNLVRMLGDGLIKKVTQKGHLTVNAVNLAGDFELEPL